MFDWEHGIAVNAVQGIRASSRVDGVVSCVFSSCGTLLGYILELRQGWPFKTRIGSATSRLLSSYEGHFMNLHDTWQGNTNASRGEAGD